MRCLLPVLAVIHVMLAFWVYGDIRKRGLYIMHPGPVNRGVELCDAVMDYERTLINDQVENGIAVRMAVLYWLKPRTGNMSE